jgi:hypothetical protein
MIEQAAEYSLKVWFTILIISSIVVSALSPNNSTSVYEYVLYFFFSAGTTAVIAMTISLPNLLFFFLLTYVFIKQSFGAFKVKMILSFVAVLLCIMSLLWIFDDFSFDRIQFMVFPLVTIVSVWFHDLIHLESTANNN